MPKPCLIGLDGPEIESLRLRIDHPMIAHDMAPKVMVRDGKLLVESPQMFGFLPVSCVLFHGIFENDHDLISALALWGGPCLPNAQAMMDCRLKLPCLVRALRYTSFGSPHRGYASAGVEYETTTERVAKWGNWHCGENKARFDSNQRIEHSSIIEDYLEGEAVRVVLIGDSYWQIELKGDDWLKSIHHEDARLTEVNPELLEDTRAIAKGFGLEIVANDYIITDDGTPHLLEVNHIPNVTRFPEIWEAYADFAAAWIRRMA